MPLIDVQIPISGGVLPDDVAALLREADLRINEFIRNDTSGGTGFIPSDFVTVYHALRAVTEANLAAGNSFCEWGSGFGVVTSLAAMLGFDASGVEIKGDLVDAAQQLADDFELSPQFVHGSFIPSGAEAEVEQAYADSAADSSHLVTDADDAYDELELDPDDFDLVFTYPWPGEEVLVAILFEKYAADGALLMMYDQYDSVKLQRKVSG